MAASSSFSSDIPNFSAAFASNWWKKNPKLNFNASKGLNLGQSPLVFGEAPPAVNTDESATAVPDAAPAIKQQIEQFTELFPYYSEALQRQADIEHNLTLRNIRSTYPYISAAAAESTARNLAASKEFYKTKQQAPTTVQEIMASKQGQAASAADSEYRRALGIAAQQAAATDFARKFSGQTFSNA